MGADVGDVLECIDGHRHTELIVPGKGDHLYLAAEQGLVMMADGRAVDACALAGVHFDKAVLQRTGFDLLDGGDAVLYAVHGQISETSVFGVHAFDDAALDGEEAAALSLIRLGGITRGHHAGLVHPCLQLLVGEGNVALAVQLSLFLLGNARADEYGACAGIFLLDDAAMRQHGGEHVRQIRQHAGIVFLNERVDAVAARRNDHVVLAGGDHLFVFGFDDGCADGGLLCVCKAQLQ